jgi:hypothetical protein
MARGRLRLPDTATPPKGDGYPTSPLVFCLQVRALSAALQHRHGDRIKEERQHNYTMQTQRLSLSSPLVAVTISTCHVPPHSLSSARRAGAQAAARLIVACGKYVACHVASGIQRVVLRRPHCRWSCLRARLSLTSRCPPTSHRLRCCGRSRHRIPLRMSERIDTWTNSTRR